MNSRARVSLAAWSAVFLVTSVALAAAPATAAPPRAMNISMGEEYGCALMTTGRVECWGDNSNGQLGDGSIKQRNRPVLVRGVTHAVAVASGSAHSCAILNTGRIKCWGYNQYGQLGDGTTHDRHFPVFVRGVLHAARVSAGFAQTCALLTTGAARCWGGNAEGALGDGTAMDRHTPVPVRGLLSGVTWISAGIGVTCAVQRHVAKCWGHNFSGEVGDGTTVDRHIPRVVLGLGTHTVIANAGRDDSCALVTRPGNGNALFCWGANSNGQLGDGTTTGRHRAVPVLGMQTNVTSVSMGGESSACAVRLGAVKCWGLNQFGQLGDGTTIERHRPRQVVGLTRGVVRVEAALFTQCARLATGRVKCWGYGSAGELGNGSTGNRHRPVFVQLI